ncbi:hypothetical protein WDU94_004461 [Cyamophila willieti]
MCIDIILLNCQLKSYSYYFHFQILFLVKARYQGWKFYFHFNLFSSLFATWLMLPYTDDSLIILNLVVSVGMHVVTMTRSHVSKKPQSLV